VKNFFIASHLYSGYDRIVTSLNNIRGVKAYNTNRSYSHPQELISLFKRRRLLTIAGDAILYNNSLSSKAFFAFSKFIYIIRNASSIGLILEDERLTYNEDTATRYYCFRLQRLYEMACQTPDAIFLTWEQVRDGDWTTLVQNYLELPDKPVPINEIEDIPGPISSEYRKRAEECYEKYLYRFKNSTLKNLFHSESS
jgi:hypothetical protein